MSLKQTEKFLKILEKNNHELFRTAKEILNKKVDNKDVVYEISAVATGPIIFNYTVWVIKNAHENNIKRLYFLARDGYLMFHIAKMICENYNFDIECRYLYASRIAWRLPQYHLQKEQCFEHIFSNGFEITLNKIFERAGLSKDEVSNVVDEFNDNLDLDKILSWEELQYFKEKFFQSELLYLYISNHSQEAYKDSIGYFRQEGLFDETEYAIVDIGWVGSLQQSLETLLNSASNKRIDIIGYYFGLFNIPDGMNIKNYKSFYFGKKDGLKRKVYFNHNLLECLCSSPDGMTIGYKKEEGEYVPYFASENNANLDTWPINKQITTVLEYGKKAVNNVNIKKLNNRSLLNLEYELCKELMIYPSSDVARVYGDFNFSDDVSEKDLKPLAIEMSKSQMKQNHVINRVLNKIGFVKYKSVPTQSFWIEASINRSDIKGKRWEKIDSRLFRFLLYFVSSYKN